MKLSLRAALAQATVSTVLLTVSANTLAQAPIQERNLASNDLSRVNDAPAASVFAEQPKTEVAPEKPILTSVLTNYYHPQDGISLNELISRALKSNGELQAARLDINRARARLLQARQRPNPTVEFEQSSGRILGSTGGGNFTLGASIPIEIYGRRTRRVEVAQIEIEASEALVGNRERQLTANVLTSYADALASLRELEATENLLELDLQTTRFVQIRVNEGETAPLELNLLQAEVERLRARRQLATGRLEAALTQLKLLTGLESEKPLRLREQITTALLPALPQTPGAAIEIALRTRPDVRLAQIEEQVATAGLRLVRAGARPDLTVYTRYTQGRLGFDNLAETVFPSRDRTLTFGIAIGLPIFNKQQGARAESEIAIRQAGIRRVFAERAVKSEITAALQRAEAAGRAVATLESAALPRASENLRTIRAVYEIGNISITDLIVEQRRLLDVNRDLTEALTERYRAQADVLIALGGATLMSPSQSPATPEQPATTPPQ